MLYSYLQEIKVFLEKSVCSKIKLKAPNNDSDMVVELRHPVVTIGWEAVELNSPELSCRVPSIAIGTGKVVDDGDWLTIPVELALITYSSGTVGEMGIVFDSSGYVDLINLMDCTVRGILSSGTMGETLTLAEREVEYTPDMNPMGDFYTGVISFTLKGKGMARKEKDFL